METYKYWSWWGRFGYLSAGFDLCRLGFGAAVNYCRCQFLNNDELRFWVSVGPFSLDVVIRMPWNTTGEGCGGCS